MNFFKTIQNSIYSPKFYSTIPNKSFKQSVIYFLLLILLLTTIRLITSAGPLLFEAPRAMRDFAANIINCYPKDLEIKITSGKVGINSQEPYFIPYCEQPDNNKNFAVIDTQNQFSQTKFDEYKVVVWITKTSVVYKENKFETKSYSLTQIKDFKLDEEVLNSFYDKLSPYLKFVGPALLLLSLIGIYLSYNFRLVYLLSIALIVWLAGKIFKKNLNYWQSYKIGLHAITMGLIVELITLLTYRWTHYDGFPFMVTILTLSAVVLNLFLPEKRQNHHKPS